MLNEFPVCPSIPVTDIERAVDFYQNKLGLTKRDVEMEEEAVMFEAGKGTVLYLYKRGPSKADHTLASFAVDDIEKVVDELTAKGVSFEHYDMEYIKTDEKGIATMGETKSAWFKDPDGNILGLAQM